MPQEDFLMGPVVKKCDAELFASYQLLVTSC